MSKTPIPTEVPTPRGLGLGLSDAGPIYKALFAVDPSLLPPEAIEVARRCHRWAANEPKRPKSLRDSAADWVRATAEAMRTNTAPPGNELVVKAANDEAVYPRLREVYCYQWYSDATNICSIVAAHADTIIEQLRPLWIDATEAFHQAVEAIPDSVETTADLLNVPGGSEMYQRASQTRDRCDDIASARIALTRIAAESTTGKVPGELLLVRDYTHLQRLPREEDQLQRWRIYDAALTAGKPWLPTLAEAIDAFDEIRRSWPGNSSYQRPNRVWKSL